MIGKKIKIGNNSKIVIKNAAAAFVIKGLSLVVSFFTVPAFVSYFDNNMYLGVWYALLSVIIWFLNFDLGIGNGIRNNLVKAFTNNDRELVRRIISSGLFSVSIVSVLLFLVGGLFFTTIDLQWLFNIEDSVITHHSLITSVLLVFAAIMLRFELTAVSSIFYAMQESRINNLLALLVSVLQLLFVLIFRFEDKNDALIYLSLSYIVISNAPIIIAAIIVFSTRLKDCKPSFRYIDRNSLEKIIKIGGVFFVCQILYMIIVNTNEFFIAKFYKVEDVVDYTFYYKLMSLMPMLVSLGMTPIWSVVTKAYEEKNYNWLIKLFNRINIFGIIVLLLELLMVFLLQYIMDFWLKDNSIVVNYYVAFTFAIFSAVFAYSGMLSTIVCGLARMKLQLYSYLIGVTLKIIIIIALAPMVNSWCLIVWSNILILLPYSIIQYFDLHKYLYRLKTNKSII